MKKMLTVCVVSAEHPLCARTEPVSRGVVTFTAWEANVGGPNYHPVLRVYVHCTEEDSRVVAAWLQRCSHESSEWPIQNLSEPVASEREGVVYLSFNNPLLNKAENGSMKPGNPEHWAAHLQSQLCSLIAA